MLKLRIFCGLHRPVGKVQIGYHLFVIINSFLVGFILNIFNLQPNADASITATKYIDLLLTALLSIELVLQLWSSSCAHHYREFGGKLRYLYDHLVYKLVDIIGLVTYVAFLTQSNKSKHPFSLLISVGHLIQIFQIYRLTHRILRLIARTIQYRFGYIFTIFLFTLFVFLVLSRCVFLLEKGANNKINNIYDAAWLVFITILTIGFGDLGPVTTEGKLFVIFVTFFGVISFSVMISLFGAQLANEKEKTSIVTLIPAATLIQNIWILHSMENGVFWKYLSNLTEKDKKAIICLQKVKVWASRRHFKVSQSDITAFDENVLLYEHLLNRLDFIEKNIYHNSYTLNSINKQIEKIEQEMNY